MKKVRRKNGSPKRKNKKMMEAKKKARVSLLQIRVTKRRTMKLLVVYGRGSLSKR